MVNWEKKSIKHTPLESNNIYNSMSWYEHIQKIDKERLLDREFNVCTYVYECFQILRTCHKHGHPVWRLPRGKHVI